MATQYQVNTTPVSEKTDLADFITMITRDETPFMSSIGKAKAKAVYHEWQTDELTAPTSQPFAEGDSFSTVQSGTAGNTDRTRIGNYTQINSKTVSVSGSKRAVDQAGVADEYAYQLKKRGTELKRDQEHDLVHSCKPASGSTSTRTMGGYQAYVNENVKNVIGASNNDSYTAPASKGDGSLATRTINRSASGASDDGNLAAIELSHVDDIMQTIYEAGGRATTLMTSPANKRALSSKAHGSSQNTVRNVDDTGKIRQSIELFDSDFGEIQIVPNYVMGLSYNTDRTAGGANVGAESDAKDYFALVYDPAMFAMATLRPLQETEVGQLGDSTVGQIVEETTLQVKNPKAAGLITGLNGQ